MSRRAGTGPRAARSTGLGLRALRLPWLLAAVKRPGAAGSVIGFDIGGTTVRAGLADSNGDVLAETMEPTEAVRAEALAGQLARMAAQLAPARQGPLRAAAAGCPGALNPATGDVGPSPNAPAVEGPGLRRRLEDTLGVPVELENDVNLAAAAERWCGVARDCDDFVLVNLGTGIGTGLVLDGELYRGPHGGAGEIGHLPLDGSGLTAPGPLAVFERAVAPRALMGRWRPEARPATPGDLLAAADAGDAAARAAVDEEVRLLAAGLAVLGAVLDPGLVVLGGGLGGNGRLVDRLQDAVAGAGLPMAVRPTALAGREGMLGAILLATGVASAE